MAKTKPRRTILILEQDTDLREKMLSLLKEEYIVMPVSDFAMIQDLAHLTSPSLLIIDSLLPEARSLEICRQIREQPELATLRILMMVTRESETNQIIRSGVFINDFIMKPLLWEELRACVKALLRIENRRKIIPSPQKRSKISYKQGQILEAGNLYIDLYQRKVLQNNQPVELEHPILFDLLIYMILHRGMILSREHLLQQVWGYEQVHSTRTVDVHVHWLREKLEDDPADPQRIQTVRGKGYCFTG